MHALQMSFLDVDSIWFFRVSGYLYWISGLYFCFRVCRTAV